MCVKADLTRQIGEYARPRIAVAALILQHVDRLLDLPAVLAGIDLADAQIAEGLLGIVVHRAQLLHLGHVIGDHTGDRVRQQTVQLLRAGGIASVAVQLQAVHRGIAVKLPVRVHMEQHTVNVMPSLGKLGGFLIIARPAFHTIVFLVLMVGGGFQNVQICPVRIRHIRHHANALACGGHHSVTRAAEHAV